MHGTTNIKLLWHVHYQCMERLIQNLNLMAVFRVFRMASNNVTITKNLAFSDNAIFPLTEYVTR